MKKIFATMAAMLLTVVGLSAGTAKTKQVNNESGESTTDKNEVM